MKLSPDTLNHRNRKPRRQLGKRGRSVATVLAATLLSTSLGVSFGGPALAAPGEQKKGEKADTADARAEASERFRRGVSLYKDGDFVAALVEFKRAYELEPNYRVQYNLGQTSSELKDYAAALGAFEQYLDEGGEGIEAARKKEVERTIEDLRNKVGTLTIVTNVDGAEIQVDDVVVGTSPLDEPVLVNVGRRRVVATAAGHAPARRVLEVAGTDELEVELALVDLESRPGPSGSNADSPSRPAPSSTTPVAGFVALSITGVSAVLTGVLGALALSAQSDLDTALAAFPGNASSINAAQDKTSTFSTTTDVMLGVTAALAVTTIVLFVVNPGSSSAPESEEADEVAISVSPTGAWLTGSF